MSETSRFFVVQKSYNFIKAKIFLKSNKFLISLCKIKDLLLRESFFTFLYQIHTNIYESIVTFLG